MKALVQPYQALHRTIFERLQFADGLYARSMYKLAATEYLGFLKEYPDAGKADVAHFRLGECYRHLGRLVDSEKEFRLVYASYPESEYRLKAACNRTQKWKCISPP